MSSAASRPSPWHLPADADAADAADLLRIAARTSEATLCLRSVLARHELIDDIPFEIDLALLPRGKRRPATTAPARWRHFEADTFSLGQGRLSLTGGLSIGLYSPSAASSTRSGFGTGKEQSSRTNRSRRGYGRDTPSWPRCCVWRVVPQGGAVAADGIVTNIAKSHATSCTTLGRDPTTAAQLPEILDAARVAKPDAATSDHMPSSSCAGRHRSDVVY